MRRAADATAWLQGIRQVLPERAREEISPSDGTGPHQDTELGLLAGYSVWQFLSSSVFTLTTVHLCAIILAYGIKQHMEAIFFNYVYLKLRANRWHYFYKLEHSETKCLHADKLQTCWLHLWRTLHYYQRNTWASNQGDSSTLSRHTPDLQLHRWSQQKGVYRERNVTGTALQAIRKDSIHIVPLK